MNSRPPISKKEALRLLHNSGFSLAIIVASFFAKFGVNTFLGRWLGVEVYGDYSIIIQLTTLGAAILVMGFDNSVLRFLPMYLDIGHWQDARGFLKSSMRYILISCVGFSILASLFLLVVLVLDRLRIIDLIKIHPVIFCLWLIPLLGSVTFLSGILRSLKHYGYSLIPAKVLKYLLFFIPILMIGIMYDKLTLFQTVTALGFSLIIIIFIQLWLLARSELRGIFQHKPRYQTKLWLSASAQLMASNLTFLSVAAIDIILLEIFGHNEKDVGLYGAVLILTGFTWMCYKTISVVISPLISPLAHKEPTRLQSIINLFNLILLLTVIISWLIFLPFGKSILLFFGPEFGRAYWPLLITLIGTSAQVLFGMNVPLCLYGNHPKALRNANIAALLLILIMDYFLIPKYQIYGVAITFAVARVALALTLHFVVRANFKIKPMTFF